MDRAVRAMGPLSSGFKTHGTHNVDQDSTIASVRVIDYYVLKQSFAVDILGHIFSFSLYRHFIVSTNLESYL